MPSVTNSIGKVARTNKVDKSPLWTGPCGEGLNGGVTQGMIAQFLGCRERFRVRYIEGLRPTERWNHRTGYGDMWHVCEEALARGWKDGANLQILTEYAKDMCRLHPLDQQQIEHWYRVCKVQFPIYVKHWSQHPDVANRTPLLQEQEFDVPYRLPSMRVVRLRGKWDSVDLVEGGEMNGVVLQENKSKGDIDEEGLRRQLGSGFDLQTMLYLTAMVVGDALARMENPAVDNFVGKRGASNLIAGVRYNVIRRPLAGGRGTIVQGKGTKGSKCPKCKGVGDAAACVKCKGAGRIGGKPPESDAAFYDRLRCVIDGSGEDAPGPSWFFYRWNVPIINSDIQRFRRECLDPILEDMADWYEWMKYCSKQCPTDEGWSIYDAEHRKAAMPHHCSRHFRYPYGTYSVVAEGGIADIDHYLDGGGSVGLHRAEKVFPELGGAT